MNQNEALRKICQVWAQHYARQARAAQLKSYFWLAMIILAAILMVVVALWPMPVPCNP